MHLRLKLKKQVEMIEKKKLSQPSQIKTCGRRSRISINKKKLGS